MVSIGRGLENQAHKHMKHRNILVGNFYKFDIYKFDTTNFHQFDSVPFTKLVLYQLGYLPIQYFTNSVFYQFSVLPTQLFTNLVLYTVYNTTVFSVLYCLLYSVYCFCYCTLFLFTVQYACIWLKRKELVQFFTISTTKLG